MGRNGKGQPEKKSVSFIYRRLLESTIDERAAGRVLGRMDAVFQRQNVKQEIAVPTVNSLFEGMVLQESELKPSNFEARMKAVFRNGACITPRTYKGVSYNPEILRTGERYDILDFFAWARRVQEYEPSFTFYVLDASKYWIVNAMGRMPVEQYSRDASKIAVRRLVKEFETNMKSGEIRESAELRNRYLRAMAKLLPVRSLGMVDAGGSKVLSAEDLWKDNPEYLESLQRAIDFLAAERKEGAQLRFGRFANYRRYGQEYQKWYSAMVLAEADYLARSFGVMAKLGPTSEVAFDRLIRDMLGRKYNIFWYRRLEYQDKYLVFFRDTDEQVRRKLADCPFLASWLREMTQPFFQEPISDIPKAVNELREKINELARINAPAPQMRQWIIEDG